MDQDLQTLFAESISLDHSDEPDFTRQVMQSIRQHEKKSYLLRIAAALIIVLLGSLFAVPIELANVISNTLTAPILNFGQSWFAWMLTPINNCGALIIGLLKLLSLRLRGARVNLLPF